MYIKGSPDLPLAAIDYGQRWNRKQQSFWDTAVCSSVRGRLEDREERALCSGVALGRYVTFKNNLPLKLRVNALPV